MKCPECEIELPNGSKFCGQCGTKLEMVCPNCKAPNPPQFKVCLECGHSLISPSETAPQRDLSFDEKLAKIQKCLPSGLTEKILSQKERIEGERLGARPDSSRTYMEAGKRLLERHSKYRELNAISAKDYLEKAETMFREMELELDLEQLERVRLEG